MVNLYGICASRFAAALHHLAVFGASAHVGDVSNYRFIALFSLLYFFFGNTELAKKKDADLE